MLPVRTGLTYRSSLRKEEYLDSNEVYTTLTDYITDYLKTDTGFSKLLYKYMLMDDRISGQDICLVLYEQEYSQRMMQATQALHPVRCQHMIS